MLKIKDSVDLKELEKFGFRYDTESGIWHYRYFQNIISLSNITVNSWNRTISCSDYTSQIIKDNAKGLNKIFDLIQAGLVERV